MKGLSASTAGMKIRRYARVAVIIAENVCGQCTLMKMCPAIARVDAAA